MFFFYLLFAKLQVCIVIHCKVVKRSCECAGSYLHLETHTHAFVWYAPLFPIRKVTSVQSLYLFWNLVRERRRQSLSKRATSMKDCK